MRGNDKIIPLIILAATTTGAFAQSYQDTSKKLTIVEVVNEHTLQIHELWDTMDKTAKSLSDLLNSQGKAMEAGDNLDLQLRGQLTNIINDL
jgi:hypothetical protein